MRRRCWLVFVSLLAAALVGTVAAQTLSADEVIVGIYEAVNNGDVDGAMALVAHDAVLTTMMGGEPAVRTDNETIRGWFEVLVADHFFAEFSDATVKGNRATLLLTSTGDWPNELGFDFEFEGVGVARDGLLQSLTWVATPETLANMAAANAQAEAAAAQDFQASLMADAPEGAPVVDAFSIEKIMCEGLLEWTLDASPEAWTHIHAKWFTTTEEILLETWPYVDIRISVDGQEITDTQALETGPAPLEIACPDSTTAGYAMQLDVYVPPMPEGEHTVTWEYNITKAHNDGWDDIPEGQYAVITAHLNVNRNAEMKAATMARTDAINAGDAVAATAPFAANATYSVYFAEEEGMEPVHLVGKDAIFERIAGFTPLHAVSTTRILRVDGNTVYDLGTYTDDNLKADGLDHVVTYDATTFENGEIVDYTVTVLEVVPLETNR